MKKEISKKVIIIIKIKLPKLYLNAFKVKTNYRILIHLYLQYF